jgi:hypothetical protein
VSDSHDAQESEALSGLSPSSVTPGQLRLHQLTRELDCAEAMISLANIATSMETFQRNYENARNSFERALGLIDEVRLSGELQISISHRLSALYRWLELVGPSFASR